MAAKVADAASYDAIVVGAGHNGLVTAAQLARAGWRVLVLEARDTVGGAATTGEIGKGFRVPTLAHTVGRLRGSVVRDLRLKDHGLSLVAPEVRAFAPSADGSAITLWADVGKTADGLRARSAHDATKYPDFDRLVRSLGGFLADLAATTPPDIAAPGFSDAITGLKLGRSFRGLGRRDGRTVLRVLPMAVADLVAESFETDALRAAIATRGVLHSATGPGPRARRSRCWPIRPATTGERPARRSSLAAAPARCPRRSPRHFERRAARSGPQHGWRRSRSAMAGRPGSPSSRARRSPRPWSSPGSIRSGC